MRILKIRISIMNTLKPPRGAQLDKSHPLSRGLVGCWLFNERTGNKAFDLSGNANRGTLTNMASPPTAVSGWCPSKFGGGLAFDGSDDYVDCGNDASLNFERTDKFTISAWIKTSQDAYQSIYTKMEGSTPYRGVIFAVYSGAFETNGKLVFVIRNNNVGNNHLWGHSTNTVIDGNQHFVQLSYDGSSSISGVKLYIDGYEEILTSTQDNLSDTIQTAINANIGARNASTFFFNGTIDQARIYNRALSATEIKQIYLNPYGIFQSPCEAWLYAAAAGGLPIPVAMHHYEALRA